jgi:RNA recognition motif-containing protein
VQTVNFKVNKNPSGLFSFHLLFIIFSAFGFCEYENPEGTLRCMRLLNGWQIQDKKLVVSDFVVSNFFSRLDHQILDIYSKYINM